MLTVEQANNIVDYSHAHGVSHAEAAQALGIELPASTAATAAPTSTGKPWSAAVAQDTRIPLEQAAAFLVRTEDMSAEQALKQVIRMESADVGALAQAEAKHFAERAEAAAKQDWMTSPQGIEAMGRERQAQAAADAERAEAMKVELAARGIPVEGASTEEILSIVDGMAADKAAAAEANSLQANLDAIAAMDTARGESQ